ncbi:MAG: hypothetical protein ACREK6_19350 [Candidatus Rokuibacteriota bacterium]
MTVRGPRCSLLAVLAVLLIAAGAEAAEWGGIKPGESTMEMVRTRFGAPTLTKAEKSEGYDTAKWTYESPRTPAGVKSLVVDFGLLVAGAFQGQVVRTFRLEPKPGIFTRATVLAGWGEPTHSSPVGEVPLWFFYDTGLIVYFDKEGWQVEALVFVPAQSPRPGAGGRQP